MSRAPVKLSDAAKERIKLRATYINNLAVGFGLIGGLTTLLQLLNGEQGSWAASVPVAVAFIGASIALHFVAQGTLDKLD